MKIGCHVSIAGKISLAFERAKSVGCETLQIFTQNQRQWKSVHFNEEDINNFKAERELWQFYSAPLLAHASYLINMSASENELLLRSRQALLEELIRCDQLEVDYLIIHPGSHGGKGEAWGIERVAETINLITASYHPKVQLLLETTAGQGSALGYRFGQLKQIIELIGSSVSVGVCIDTCHIFAAGYAIRTAGEWQQTLTEIKETIGLDKIKAWHLNDSYKDFASRGDRHAPVGQGRIGLECFEYLLRLPETEGTPGILEIPGGMNSFQNDLSLLKQLRKS